MSENENQVVEETTTEETAPEENTQEESSEETEETTEESTDEGINWKERALKAERAIEKAKAKAKKEPKKESSDSVEDLTIARLEARGILNEQDQEYVLRFAKAEGISPIEALNDDIVKDRLAANDRARKAEAATPRGNNRTPNATNELDAAVTKFKKTGELPDNPALVAKVLDRMAN